MNEAFIHNIDPIIGQIGGIYLWWYGLSYTLGFLALFYWLHYVRKSLDFSISQTYTLSILIASGVLIGGRTVEVIFYEWAYYRDHLVPNRYGKRHADLTHSTIYPVVILNNKSNDN